MESLYIINATYQTEKVNELWERIRKHCKSVNEAFYYKGKAGKQNELTNKFNMLSTIPLEYHKTCNSKQEQNKYK